MEENPEDAITEEREELMVSPSGEKPTRRPAHFLKPSVTSIKGPVFHLPTGAFRCSTSTPITDLSLRVEFGRCRDPLKMWKSWFDRMHSIHQSTWKEAGIYEAIVSSTYQIRVDKDIMLALAERWCSDTNTFVFDWGEGTITLEDVLVLGGHSVLGKSVLTPLENGELSEVNEKLMKGRSEIIQSKSRKAGQQGWVRLFMGSGSEIEHEAFLVVWLSRHVFPSGYAVISKSVLTIAIHLARGTRIALAPAVLSWIYRDLRLLKNAIFAKRKRKVRLNLWAPMQMVQVWAWERFPTLRPQPNPLEPSEPRMGKWNKVKKKKIENVGLGLSSARECFQWRPYAIAEKNWEFPKSYKEREEWALVGLGMDKDYESFARFLRPCELLGFGSLERYLPHRVAMQFGMDQDLPGLVARFSETSEIAWENYSRPIKDGRLYVPSRLYKPYVTTRYFEWWKLSKLAQKDAVKGAKAEKSVAKSPRKPPEVPKGKNVKNDALGTPTKRKRVNAAKSGGKDEKSITKSLRKSVQISNGQNVENDALRSPTKRKRVKAAKFGGKDEKSIVKSPRESLQISKGKNVGNDALDTLHKRKRVNKEANPVGKDKHRLVDSAGKKMSSNGKCFPCPQPQIPSSITADNVAGKKIEYHVEYGKTITRGEEMIGGSHRPCVSDGIPSGGVSITNNGGNVSTQSTTDISGLEGRTSKLEIVFARLKAEKLGIMSV